MSKSRFSGAVERVSPRGHAKAELIRIAREDGIAVAAAVDALLQGRSPSRQIALLKRLVREGRDRLGLTAETAAHLAALATDASLVAFPCKGGSYG